MNLWNWSDATLAALQDKHVIITGACQGLGEQFAYFCTIKLVSRLVLASPNSDLLSTVANRCSELGCSKVKCVVFDGNELSCENLINESVQFFDGAIDILILNHARERCEFTDFNAPPKQIVKNIRETTEVEYLGYATLAHLALPHMTEDLTTTIASSASSLTITVTTPRKTNIIVASSFASLIPVPRTSARIASKSATNCYFTALRDELHHMNLAKNLSVTIYVLGPIGTEDEPTRKQTEDLKRAVEKIIAAAVIQKEEWVFVPRSFGYLSWLGKFMPGYLSNILYTWVGDEFE